MPTDEQLAQKFSRNAGIRDYVAAALLLMNFSGLVWGAATMNSSVKQLESSVNRLSSVGDGLSLQMAQVREDYGERIRLLEFQISELRSKTTH